MKNTPLLKALLKTLLKLSKLGVCKDKVLSFQSTALTQWFQSIEGDILTLNTGYRHRAFNRIKQQLNMQKWKTHASNNPPWGTQEQIAVHLPAPEDHLKWPTPFSYYQLALKYRKTAKTAASIPESLKTCLILRMFLKREAQACPCCLGSPSLSSSREAVSLHLSEVLHQPKESLQIWDWEGGAETPLKFHRGNKKE